ncbi:MAG: PKD domain-containing protein [Bacteroidota bacterium]
MNKISFKLLGFIKSIGKLSIIFLLVFFLTNVNAQQYNITGSAVPMVNPGCYRLTNTTGQGGAVWNIYKINLTQAFDITLTLNFGNRSEIHYVPATCGADGIAFILQPLSSGIVGTGSGAGFHGITPSVGVVMDTYVDNPTDPSYQHISINKNGDELHATTNELAPPTAAVGFPTNITDGLDHLFRFKWNPTISGIGTMNIYFGNATVLPTTPTITYTGNIVANIFANDPDVYWGVTGTTGGCWNVQYVCMTTISNFLSDSTTCAGVPVNFTNNSVSGLPITSWMWHFGDGDSSNLASPIHTYNSPGNYNVSLAIVNSGGFSSTMTHSIIVHPLPNVVVNDPIICKGDTAVLTATGATTYTWNNGLIPGAVQHVVPLQTTFYVVKGITIWGCSSKDTALVTVNPLPIVNLTNDTSICIGDSAKLTISGAISYLWSTTQTSSSIIVSPVIDSIFLVAATDINGCILDTAVHVYMYESPQLSFSFSPNPAEGCAPVIVSYTDESTPLLQTWLWNFGDGNTSTQQNPTHSYNIPGDFDISLSVTTTHGCFGTLTLPTFVKVFENPTASFTSNNLQFSLSFANVLFNSTASSANVNQWHWDFGNTSLTDDSSNLQNPSYQYLNQGSFKVWLYVKTIHGCTDSTTLTITVIEDSLVFPNIITPNGDGINDYLYIKNLENVPDNTLRIFNRWGKKIYEKDHYIPDIDRWDGNDLSDGTYYYILTFKGILQQGEHKSSLMILRK